MKPASATADAVARAERLLTEAAAASGARREELLQRAIVDCLPLACAVARRYHGRGEPDDDLAQVAALALVKAVRRFRAGERASLVGYATSTVDGELKRHFRDRTWLLRPPRRLQELRLAARAAEPALAQRLGRSPNTAELSRELGVDEAEVVEMRQAALGYSPTSLDHVIDSAGGPDDEKWPAAELDAVNQVLDRLPDRQRTAVAMYYFGESGQQEIADRLGVSQVQVSRLISAALSTVRTTLQQEELTA